jgi:hypothetical protein
MSVCLQKHLAQALMRRVSTINGRDTVRLQGHGYAYETVRSHDQIRVGVGKVRW